MFLGVGDFDITSLWETTETQNYGEDAWAWRWALLFDQLRVLFLYSLDLHAMRHYFWLRSRYYYVNHLIHSFFDFTSIWLIAVNFHAGLSIFKLNSYSIQFVFYFMYMNVQITFGFLVAAFFSDVKTAASLTMALNSWFWFFLVLSETNLSGHNWHFTIAVVGYIYVIGTGFLAFLFKRFLQDLSIPSK